MTGLQITGSGRDDYGKFVVSIPGVCQCPTHNRPPRRERREQDVVIKYLSWNHSIPLDQTLLKRRANAIGITCGCYARLQRQLVHLGGDKGS